MQPQKVESADSTNARRVTDEQAAVFAAYDEQDAATVWYRLDPTLEGRAETDSRNDEFEWLRDLALDLLSARESLAATKSALAEAIADARSMMEERDEARANMAAFCGDNERLKKECEAWRGYDRAINQTDRMAHLSDALRLREENEEADRG
jgi:hypothetical protein